MSEAIAAAFHVFAPAKVNLFLHVTGKRADDYHTLQSLMVFVDVGDRLSFKASDVFKLDVQGPFAAGLVPAEENLVYKAARKLSEACNVDLRGHVTLTKNLPPASGIGGGSTDAAAALKGFAELWGLTDVEEKLPQLALSLGADVPACLAARPVFAEGIGEVLTPVEVQPCHMVLVNPLVPTATPDVFKKRCGDFMRLQPARARYTLPDIRAARNSLTEAAEAVTPVIVDVLASISQTGDVAVTRLSGSGATCFGLYETEKAARAAAVAIKAQHPDWWVVPTCFGLQR